jgi:hypothetical protein
MKVVGIVKCTAFKQIQLVVQEYVEEFILIHQHITAASGK